MTRIQQTTRIRWPNSPPIHELHSYHLPLPSPEGCGPAHFAQQREIGARSEGGTSGLRWYVANSFCPFLPTDLYPLTLAQRRGFHMLPMMWVQPARPRFNSGRRCGFDDMTTMSMPRTQRQCLEHSANTPNTMPTLRTQCQCQCLHLELNACRQHIIG